MGGYLRSTARVRRRGLTGSRGAAVHRPRPGPAVGRTDDGALLVAGERVAPVEIVSMCDVDKKMLAEAAEIQAVAYRLRGVIRGLVRASGRGDQPPAPA